MYQAGEREFGAGETSSGNDSGIPDKDAIAGKDTLQQNDSSSRGGQSEVSKETTPPRAKLNIDKIAPSIQGALPNVAKRKNICFTVQDKTVNEEISFIREVDGVTDSEKGPAPGSYCFKLEEVKDGKV